MKNKPDKLLSLKLCEVKISERLPAIRYHHDNVVKLTEIFTTTNNNYYFLLSSLVPFKG